jgi:uncharacterized repeat protein (TIGR04076 family)
VSAAAAALDEEITACGTGCWGSITTSPGWRLGPTDFFSNGAEFTLTNHWKEDMKIKLTIIESKCRSHLHKVGDEYIVGNLCPPICHELWQCIYPSVYALLNGGDLDCGDKRTKQFCMKCPDQGRVIIKGELIKT